MTTNERFNDLTKRLHALKEKNAISDEVYSAVETTLRHAKHFAGMENPPGLQIDLLVIQGLDTAEKLIKRAEDKSS